MDANIRRQDGIIFVSGHVNFETVPVIWRQSLALLPQEKGGKIFVDFSDMKSSTSAAIGLMLEWIRYSQMHDQTLHFKNVPSQINSIIEAAYLKPLMNAYL